MKKYKHILEMLEMILSLQLIAFRHCSNSQIDFITIKDYEQQLLNDLKLDDANWIVLKKSLKHVVKKNLKKFM